MQHASFYLSGRISDWALEFIDGRSAEKIESEYYEIASDKRPKQRAKRLDAWCQAHLTTAERAKLQAAIRKRRERWEQGPNERKTVTISAKAQRLLAELEKRDQVTYSEALERYLTQVLNRAPRTTRRKRR